MLPRFARACKQWVGARAIARRYDAYALECLRAGHRPLVPDAWMVHPYVSTPEALAAWFVNLSDQARANVLADVACMDDYLSSLTKATNHEAD